MEMIYGYLIGLHQKDYSISFYLVILCIFCVINSCLILARAFSFAFGGLRAAVKVHNTLLEKLINAPVRFFDQTPSGRILNSQFRWPAGNCGGFVVCAVFLPSFATTILFFYRSTSRQLRRLDSVSGSPIYASFTETLEGAATIRAFNSEEYILARFLKHVTLYQKTSQN